jgi:hypothetical protein
MWVGMPCLAPTTVHELSDDVSHLRRRRSGTHPIDQLGLMGRIQSTGLNNTGDEPAANRFHAYVAGSTDFRSP